MENCASGFCAGVSKKNICSAGGLDDESTGFEAASSMESFVNSSKEGAGLLSVFSSSVGAGLLSVFSSSVGGGLLSVFSSSVGTGLMMRGVPFSTSSSVHGDQDVAPEASRVTSIRNLSSEGWSMSTRIGLTFLVSTLFGWAEGLLRSLRRMCWDEV